MAGDSLDRLEGGQKDGCLMAFHSSNQQLLEAFSVKTGFSYDGSRLGCVKSSPNSDLVGLEIAKGATPT